MDTSFSIESAVRLIADTAVDQRDNWDRLDAAAADGDFGSTMHRGFRAVLDQWDGFDRSNARIFLTAVSEVLSGHMGGSSGPLWAVSFLRAGQAFDRHGLTAAGTSAALSGAIEAIQSYGGAKVGDKTLLDALVPAAEALQAQIDRGETDPALVAAAVAHAARAGADSTTEIRARRGRSAYAGDRSIGTVDPGAAAIAVLAAKLATFTDAKVTVPDYTAPSDHLGDESVPVAEVPTKQFINHPDDAVTESLAGYAMAHPDLVTWNEKYRILHRPSRTPGRVGLVAGGGSGHEPLHGGFVGPGMLTAVAPGPVFASPTVHQILHATLVADAGAGVVHLIKNYTGDVINFGIAAELANERNVQVRRVIVNDDVGADETSHDVGRRGTGATVIVEKMAGAAAEQGASIDAVVEVSQRAVDGSASFGVALGSCSPPGRSPIFDLGLDEIEVGVGIHGEPGRRRSTIEPAAWLVDEAVTAILARLDLADRSPLLAFVSGLGATTLMEQYIVYREVERAVSGAGQQITRRLVGPYITALNMPGVLITLMILDDELTGLWDAPVNTAALRWGI